MNYDDWFEKHFEKKGYPSNQTVWDAAVSEERIRCANIARNLYMEWEKTVGKNTAYDAGRLTALSNVFDAIKE